MPEQKNRRRLPLILIGSALYLFGLFLIIPTPPEIVMGQQSRVTYLGKETNEFDGLLARIKEDIGKEDVEIKVLIGPYFSYLRIVGLLYDDFRPTYYILIDEDFYNELTPEEKEALVAHESGHILYLYPIDERRQSFTDIQVLADTFAAKYVHPQHLKGLLRKANYDYLTRMENLDNLERSPSRPLNNNEPAPLKIPSDIHSGLIEVMSRDLKLKKTVEIVFIPGSSFPGVGFEESDTSYQILIGEIFFFSLSELEQKALIAHEIGHAVFLPPVCNEEIRCQIGADLIATGYVSPKALIDLLPKMSDHPQWTEMREYRARLEYLELLPQER